MVGHPNSGTFAKYNWQLIPMVKGVKYEQKNRIRSSQGEVFNSV